MLKIRKVTWLKLISDISGKGGEKTMRIKKITIEEKHSEQDTIVIILLQHKARYWSCRAW